MRRNVHGRESGLGEFFAGHPQELDRRKNNDHDAGGIRDEMTASIKVYGIRTNVRSVRRVATFIRWYLVKRLRRHHPAIGDRESRAASN